MKDFFDHFDFNLTFFDHSENAFDHSENEKKGMIRLTYGYARLKVGTESFSEHQKNQDSIENSLRKLDFKSG